MVVSKRTELLVFSLLVILAVAVSLYFQDSSSGADGTGSKVVLTPEIIRIQHKEAPLTFEESRKLAEFLLRSAPTFSFDGIPDSVRYLGSLNGSCSSCWNHSFSFMSEHPGFGSVEKRGSAANAKFQFAHLAVVVMNDKTAEKIILDSSWDDVSQSFVSQ